MRAPSAAALNMQIAESEFLTVDFTTQLQDQDPLQPTDPSQFLGQLEGR
jgi:flagellar hook assembly protein FlgD